MPAQDEQTKSISLTTIHGIASQTLNRLAKLNLLNFYDLIFFLPFRYEDKTFVLGLNEACQSDTARQQIVTLTSSIRRHAKITDYEVVDLLNQKGRIMFFHLPKFLESRLTQGTTVIAYGPTSIDTFNYPNLPVIRHPDIVFINDPQELELPQQLSPIYHLTTGITQIRMRHLVETGLKFLCQHPLKECIPDHLNPFHMSLNKALLLTHNPPADTSVDHVLPTRDELPSFRRICFEELIAYKLSILELHKHQEQKSAPALTFHKDVQLKLLEHLPFQPTSAQSRVFTEIMHDCQQTKAMSRLVHGDVGSGKTLVAAMVMLQCAANDMQSTLLAPTDLLARQHARKLSELFAPLGIEVGLLNGTLRKKEREKLLAKIASGELKIIVGTHAVFQKDVQYQNLALSIIDEQHRFGVDQREALLNKAPEGFAAHELLMTATPIPRSLQQALFAETDVSTLDVLPKGRAPITTSVANIGRMNEVIEHVRRHCQGGNQAYWVCPLVEEREVQDSTLGSVKKRFAELEERLPEIKLGLLHGQMSEKAKTSTMEAFLQGEIQILVATTIVEVGVDVPDASLIVIENAERLGLAQLHQLRGRVGRGTKPSFCLLMYQYAQRTDPIYERGIQRLNIMKNSTNGFDIANQDLLMRGPGEFFGTNQAGKENFRFVDINRDIDLLEPAQHAALEIFTTSQEYTHDLIERWFPQVLEETLD